MKKFLLSILLLSLTFGLKAAEIPQRDTAKKEDAVKISLYAEDNDKKVIDTLPLTTQLIKIYQKGDWIKVGNPKDGTVGWINQKQYQKMIADMNHFNIQQIFISHTTGKNSQPENKLVVYQNGNPVSEKEAKEIYNSMRKQLDAQQEYWTRFNQNMIASKHQMLEDFLENPFFTQSVGLPLPVIVIEKNDNANSQTHP